MILLGLWFLAAFGFAYVIGYSKISYAVRVFVGGLREPEVEAVSISIPGPITEWTPGTDVFRGAPPAVTPVRGWMVPPAIPYVGPWFAALSECPACLGWWFGFAAGGFGLIAMPGVAVGLIAGLLLAFATSAVNLLLARWVGLIP